MFEAVIIACLSLHMHPNNCITVVDTYGPYLNKSQCESRIEQMRPMIIEDMFPYIPLSWQCSKPEFHLKHRKIPL
tara:strand:- start:1248 stop:1472 length:225 start_codon:yes stop_codon:yes gene_type:complete